MPRVAVVAAGMFVLWALLSSTPVAETAPDNLLDVLTFAVVCFTLLYYAVRAGFWLKRKLLWRVRRRLIITYLFVGVTPLVLLGILGALAWAVLSGQAMTRVVQVEINATERTAREAADALARDLLRQPAGMSQQAAQQWLDDRVSLLRAGLPGARVSVWRGGAGATNGTAAGETLGTLGQARPAELYSAPEGAEETAPVGIARPSDDAPLPRWLEGQAEWSGFAFTAPPEESPEPFGAPSIRALVRRQEGGRAAALLVTVPVSRALVRRMRESTGIDLRPYFVGARAMNVNVGANGDGVKLNSRALDENGQQRRGLDLKTVDDAQVGSRDQFGDSLPAGAPYVVLLPATDWADGVADTRLSFMFEYSWAEARRQLLDSSAVGEVLKRVLFAVAVVFLALEVLALMGAAWMTRAVTGTVHKLYRATELVKRGDFSHRIRARSHDQLGELAGAFDEMSANIEALLKERVERERLEREVEIAHEVQAQLFPRSVPALSSAEVAGECRAARGVAGDHYDYIEIEPGLLAFALGDVSGKGLSAALVMSNLQAALRAQVTIIAERRRLAQATTAAASSSASVPATLGACGVAGADASCAVENMVASINRQLRDSTDSNRFVTLFLAVYDDRARTLRYTNAGHNAPVLVRASGAVERLTVGGTIVGVFDFVTYEEARVELGPGDLLVVFSDGISEAQNATGEEYGEDRLSQFAARQRALSADDLRRAIFAEVDRWTGAQERGDDQTLVILKAVTSEE